MPDNSSTVSELPASVAVCLAADVKAGIQEKQKNGSIRQRVVETLVEEEVVRRSTLLAKALVKRNEQAKEVEKIMDLVGYLDGSISMSSFSKAKYDELKKAKEQLAKIEKAIANAINEANYDEVSKVVGS